MRIKFVLFCYHQHPQLVSLVKNLCTFSIANKMIVRQTEAQELEPTEPLHQPDDTKVYSVC